MMMMMTPTARVFAATIVVVVGLVSSPPYASALSPSSPLMPQRLQQLTTAASLSYLDDSSIKDGSKEQESMMKSSPYFPTSQLDPLCQIVDPTSQSGATIFRDTTTTSNKNIIVACRGSANLVNFATNVKLSLVPVKKELLAACPDGSLIHQGFQDASLGLWHQLGPALLDAVGEQQSTTITFTGHSLGAATALLCAAQYATTTTNNNAPYSVLTLAGPRLVNGILADHLQTTVLKNAGSVVNLIHSHDPILRQNQPLWDKLGFEVVGDERLCEKDSVQVYETGDFEKDVVAWDFLNHCRYLGLFVGPRLPSFLL